MGELAVKGLTVERAVTVDTALTTVIIETDVRAMTVEIRSCDS